MILKAILLALLLKSALCLTIAIGIPVVILFVECLLSFLSDNKNIYPKYHSKLRPSVAVLIPAHNEQQVICHTLSALAPQLNDQDRLVVIADNCTDNTAHLARELKATVLERDDLSKRGKGYALDYGLNFIRANPPEVVVLIDADCLIQEGSIDQLVRQVIATQAPAQAVYVMENSIDSSSKSLISALAFKIKNLVRPKGLDKLGLPCLLTGTGMAFPWSVISEAPLASDNIVEDMQLGIDLAIAGHAPLFCAQAKVTGILPESATAANSQKTRWIHGHLQTMWSQGPRLLKASFNQKRWDLLAIALDLCVPPISFLVTGWLITLLGGLIALIFRGEWAIVLLSSIEGILIFASIIGAWAKFAQNDIPFKTLLTMPVYFLWKITILLAFLNKPQQTWVKTERGVL